MAKWALSWGVGFDLCVNDQPQCSLFVTFISLSYERFVKNHIKG